MISLTRLSRSLLLLFSVGLGLRGSNYITLWISLEVNILCFLALLWSYGNSLWSCVPKYFVVQAVGSSGILMAVLLSFVGISWWFNFFILVFLGLKLGVWPFHVWFINLRKKLRGWALWLLFTLQKILPVGFLGIFAFNDLGMLALLRGLYSGVAVILNNSFFIILTYSSIFTTSWLLLMSENLELVLFFLLCYSAALFLLLNNLTNLWYVDDKVLTLSKNSNWLYLSAARLRIIGVPPSLGFLGKMVSSQYIFEVWGFVFLLRMLILRVIFIYFYSSVALNEFIIIKEIKLELNYYNLVDFLLVFILWVWPLWWVFILKVSINNYTLFTLKKLTLKFRN